MPAGDWLYWLIKSGRGFGKTRTAGELVRYWIENEIYGRLAFIGPTAGDVRDIMIEGESGILAISPRWMWPHYEPSKRRLTWPNGAQASLFSADEPDRLRGPQHDAGWCEEIAAWKYANDAWDMFQFGLRLGNNPRAVLTSTPRPIKLIKELVADPDCIVTNGSTYENKANLAPSFFQKIIRKYEGTRLGRQEIHGEILDDTPGALWTLKQIDATRVKKAPPLEFIVVAVDPAATSNEDSNETGIIVCGRGIDRHGYVLADRTVRGTPREWAQAAVDAYHEFEANRIIGEVNNGGEMVGYTIETVDSRVPYKAVRASRGKHTRAEPVSAIYEKGEAHHVGTFPVLEDQMTTWVPGMDSPDRMDGLVWGFTELLVDFSGGQGPATPKARESRPVTAGLRKKVF